MPGPVTAVTVTNGSQRREAGALIALGHGLIELPVILLIYFGLASFFESEAVRIGVGIGGGLVLIWMGLNMFHSQRSVLNEQKVQARGSILAGVTLTAANPYFFVWWATVGATLVVSARDFGSAGVAAMGVTHWLCDFGWLLLISLVVYKSRHLWTQRVNRVVFGICSAILAGFGSWFIVSSITLAASS